MNKPSIKNAFFASILSAAFSLTISHGLCQEGESNKQVPRESKVVVVATAGSQNPVKIGRVTAGQKVTLTIGRVLWRGAGSRTGDTTDWRGYRDRSERNALPWMALVAAVGKQNFLPDKKKFIFTVPADGELVLFANDDKPDDNSGKGEVIVRIDPK